MPPPVASVLAAHFERQASATNMGGMIIRESSIRSEITTTVLPAPACVCVKKMLALAICVCSRVQRVLADWLLACYYKDSAVDHSIMPAN